MKRLLLAAAACATMAIPLAAPAFADPPRASHQRYDDHRDGRRSDRVVVTRTHVWHRGDHVNRHSGRIRDVDYRAYHLKPPPRGQRYVRDDNTGEILLAAIATGLIISVLAN